MLKLWHREIRWLILLILSGLLVGYLFDINQWAVVVFLLAYIARHLRNIYKLEIELRLGSKNSEHINGGGIWDDIDYHLHQLRRQNKKRKKRITKILKRVQKSTAALPDATVVLTLDYEVDWFNKSAGRLLGLKKPDRGQHIINFVRHPEFIQYIRSGDFSERINIPAPRDPDIELEISVVDYSPDARLLSAYDVTQRRQLERTQRDFVANVSHELKTPITVLRGYIETLHGADGAVAERYQGAFGRMQEQVERMQYLVDDLLLLTRLESGLLARFDEYVVMSEILSSVVSELADVSRQRAKIELSLESDAALLGNEQELSSVVSNLVGNALKYTPDNGEVQVRWCEDEASGGMRLEVEDSGAGIESRHLSRLTERFYRVDSGRSRQMGGTGLGLAIVKRVLNRHGAELLIRSELNKGSCFSCIFKPERVIRASEERLSGT